MIGVMCREGQEPFVEEFFELFKTPWEFCVTGKAYDVIVLTSVASTIPDARLVIACGQQIQPWDAHQVTAWATAPPAPLLQYRDGVFPVYRGIATFASSSQPLVTLSDSADVVGTVGHVKAGRLIRLGYDLFDEVAALLTDGQPSRFAAIPTLDVHIDLLRRWIADAGVSFIEIPPCPAGSDFTVCLTHDVDFVNLRDHGVDRSVLGFVYRALFPLRLRDTKSRIAWSRLFKNWLAVFSLPAVYLRLCRDVWFDIDRYQEIETGLASTYFFIPFKGQPGAPLRKGHASPLRAAPYDAASYATLIGALAHQHTEIATHGIDAWQSPRAAELEGAAVRRLSGQDSVGIRMHWLYFDHESPKVLEEAGFLYDSTLGYNDAIGFRSGTAQVFGPPGTSRLLELPLNVMDSALFYPSRMGLPEAEALAACKTVVNAAADHGGVLTINWHTRSLQPERNWDSFYIELIEYLKNRRVWFATGSQVTSWFKARRSITFDDVGSGVGSVRIRPSVSSDSNLPSFVVRVHRATTVGDAGGQEIHKFEDRLLPLTSSSARTTDIAIH